MAFTVRNLEHQTTQYRYTISLQLAESASDVRVLDSGQLTMKHDSAQNVIRTFALPPLTGRVKIAVSLQHGNKLASNKTPPQTQAIHYWATMTNLPTAGGGES